MGKKKSMLAIILSISLVGSTFSGLPVRAEEENDVSLQEYNIVLGSASSYGYIPAKRTVPEAESESTSKRSQKKSDSQVTLPSSYDSRESNLVTSVKDQKDTGMCWAFAVTGASESRIIKKDLEESPDLSEYHLTYSSYVKVTDPLGLTEEDVNRVSPVSNDSVYDFGGDDYIALAPLARWQGLVNEEIAPLKTLFEQMSLGKTAILDDSVMYAKDSYHLQNAEFITLEKNNIDKIKEKIMEYGAGTISLHTPETMYELNTYTNTLTSDFTAYYSDDPDSEINHEVIVVGWDDDYAVSNFNPNCQPSKPGAWLIRNSWGDNNTMGGYFWLSYEDAALQFENNSMAEVIFYDAEPADNYDYNYQYDGGIPAGIVQGASSIANVFTLKGDEKLQAVSFYTQERNVNYEISIYRISDPSQPENGTKAGTTLTGVAEERGYHTIDFSDYGASDFPMPEGTMFSVVLTLTNANGKDSYYTYEVGLSDSEMDRLDGAITGDNIKSSIAAGDNESLVMQNGTWSDFARTKSTEGKTRNANWCLKAFTSKATAEEIAAAATPEPTADSSATPAETAPATDNSPTPAETAAADNSAAPAETAAADNSAAPAETAAADNSATPAETAAASADTIGNNNISSQEVSEKTQEGASKKNSPIVKKIKFTKSRKKLKAGSSLNLKKYLKITKKKAGPVKLQYKFAKKSDKKYAALSSSGRIKAKKKGKGKTVTVYALAKDGSGKKAKIKIQIR